MPIDERWEALKVLAEEAGEIGLTFDQSCTKKARLNIACTPQKILELLSTLSATQRELEEAKEVISGFELAARVNHDEHAQMMQEIGVPECPLHGGYCAPHVGNWMRETKSELSTTQRERDELKEQVATLKQNLNDAMEGQRERQKQFTRMADHADEGIEQRDKSEARVAELETALSAMTEDRNLWQGEHDEDCPNLARVAELEKALKDPDQRILDVMHTLSVMAAGGAHNTKKSAQACWDVLNNTLKSK